jgi:hypothetical protein
VLLITAIILPFVFKDKIIEFVKKEVNDNVNATVSWGDFDLTLISSFPSFRFSIHDVKVIGKDDFAKDTLANIPEMDLDLNIWSVIMGDQYKVNSILLDKPRINVRVLKDGKANYDITKPDTTAAAATTPTKFKLALKKLKITDGYIVYDDASLGVMTKMDKMNYELSGDFTQDNFEMKNDLNIDKFTLEYGGMTYLKQVKTVAKAALDMDMVNWKFTFKDNDITLNELGIGLNGFFAMPGDDYNMDLSFNAKQSDFRNFLSLIPGAYTTDFANVKTAGKLSFTAYLKGLYSEKQNKMPGFGLKFNIADAMVQYPGVPKSISGINVDCNIDDASGDPDATKIDVNKFHVDFGGNPIDATLHVATPVSDASLDGTLKCNIDLATMKDVMPLSKDDQLNGKVSADITMKGKYSQIEHEQYDQFNCSGSAAISNMLYKTKSLPYDMNITDMKMNFTPQYVTLSNFDGKIGKNDMHATGRIDNMITYFLKDSLLTGTFDFSSQMMDLNQFMGSDETASGATPAPADTAAMAVIDVPGNINFTLNSTITKLIYEDINIDNVSGKVTIKDKVVDVSQLRMSLMGGSMLLNGKYSTASNVPNVDLNMNITDFDIQQTFKYFNTVAKLAPVAKYTTGKFSSSLNFKSDLDQAMMPIQTSINGQGTLSTKQVVVSGFEPLKKLDEALKMKKFSNVTLNDLNLVSFKIVNGAVSTEPFDFKAGKSTGKIGGSTGVDQSISYVMDMSIPRTEFGPVNSALDGMVSSVTAKGIPFKLGDMVNVSALFGGTVTNPTVKTSLKEAGGNMMDDLKNQVTDLVKDKADSLKNVGINKACVQADQDLATATQNAATVRDATKKTALDAKNAAYAAALKQENSSTNPIQKIANKKAADLARKAADDAYTKSCTTADNTYNSAVKTAQDKHDAICK